MTASGNRSSRSSVTESSSSDPAEALWQPHSRNSASVPKRASASSSTTRTNLPSSAAQRPGSAARDPVSIRQYEASGTSSPKRDPTPGTEETSISEPSSRASLLTIDSP